MMADVILLILFGISCALSGFGLGVVLGVYECREDESEG